MRLILSALLGLALAVPLVNQAMGEEVLPKVTTGSKTWSMADGGTRKLRFVEFGKHPDIATFQWGAAPGGIPLATFSAESRTFLDAIRDGRIKLLKTPGLSAEANFPSGPLRDPFVRDYRVGILREWTHRNGRKVTASMINLTDEVVSLLIGDKVWNLAMEDVSEADRQYLEEVKAGKERTEPLRVSLGRHSWEKENGRDVSISGYQVLGEPANDRRFEEAMARAIATVSSKLERDYWEFHELREVQVSRPLSTNYWGLLAPPDHSVVGPEAVYYQATFLLNPRVRAKAVGVWPYSVSPTSIRSGFKSPN
jgi:hypothetical protein